MPVTGSPRVLVFSERAAESPKWQAAQYEFEDLILDLDAVELLAPAAMPRSVLRELVWSVRASAPPQLVRSSVHRAGRLGPRFQAMAARRLVRARRMVAEPKIEPVTIAGEYRLFFSVFMFPYDIPHLLRLSQWRERCEKAVCYIPELWVNQLEEMAPYLELLEDFGFDHVFVSSPRLVERVAEIAGCPCSYMPMGIDTVSFSPYPEPPPRVIDIFQMGRRSAATHEAALDMARRDGAFYLYDTVFKGPLPDYRSHRELLAETLKRTRYFICYPTSADRRAAQGEDQIAYRYFEGISGGTIILGQAPDVPEFAEAFGWPDSTVPIPYEAHDLREVVAALDEQPERLARARAANVANALRRHDWAYRWARVLDVAGLPYTPAMHERFARLDALAGVADASVEEPAATGAGRGGPAVTG